MLTVGVLGLVAASILAAVFAAAGIAKLADRDGTLTAVREFGAPKRLAGLLALLLPAAELAVAILLLSAPTRAVGAAGALALLGLFSTAIMVSLTRGRTPDCHCFGQLHSAPAGWKTLGRNGVLAGLGGLTLAAGLAGETPSVVAWLGGFAAAEIATLVLGITVVLVAVGGTLAFLSLLRSYGSALVRLETIEQRLAEAGTALQQEEFPPELGHQPGTPAPSFTSTDAGGEPVSLDDLLAPGLPLLLLFSSPTCGPCDALLPDVAAWQAEHEDRVTIAIASAGDREASLAKAEEHGLDRVLVDHDLEIHEAFAAGGTPSAVLVARDGTISSYVAPGADSIELLLERALTESAESDEEGLPVGSPAPELDLVTLDGAPVSLVSTGESLVLFWNPDCGFCSSMRDELLAWERHPPAGAPRLLVVSSGDEASTRAEGFSSTVALDPEFTVGESFGAGGTPMAILLDREGRIASSLAAGAEAVFALAGGHGRADTAAAEHMAQRVAP